MSYIDIAILILLVAFAASGWIRGFIKELFFTVGLVAGAFFASRYALDVGQAIPLGDLSDGAVKLVGFAVVFVAVFGFGMLLGFVLNNVRFVKGSPFVSNLIHQVGGALMGAVRLVVILAIVLYALSSTKKIGDLMQKNFSDSSFYEPLKMVGSKIIKLDLSLEGVKYKAEKMVDEITEIGVEFTKEKIGDR